MGKLYAMLLISNKTEGLKIKHCYPNCVPQTQINIQDFSTNRPVALKYFTFFLESKFKKMHMSKISEFGDHFLILNSISKERKKLFESF